MQINNNYSLMPVFAGRNNTVKLSHSKIIEMVETGVPVKEIGLRLNTNPQNIYRYLRSIGISPTRKSRTERKIQVNDVILKNLKLFVHKKTPLESIAKQIGITVKEINTWLNENGYRIKGLLRLEMFKVGMTPQEVSKECGISVERAYQLKREFQKENLIPLDEPKDKTIQEIQEELKTGISGHVLAEKYNLSHTTIYRYRKMAEIPNSITLDIRKDEILRLAKEGLNLREISKELGITETSVQNTIRKYNLLPIIKEFKQDVEDKILADAQKGCSIDELAEKYDCAPRTISYRIKRAKERLVAKNAD